MISIHRVGTMMIRRRKRTYIDREDNYDSQETYPFVKMSRQLRLTNCKTDLQKS